MKPKESPPEKQGPRPEIVAAAITAASAVLVAAITVLPNLIDRTRPTPTPAVAAVTVAASPVAAQIDALVVSPAAPSAPPTAAPLPTTAPPTTAPTQAPSAPAAPVAVTAPTTAPLAGAVTSASSGIATAAPAIRTVVAEAPPTLAAVSAPAAPVITAANAARLEEARVAKIFGSPSGIALSQDGKQLVVQSAFEGEVYDFAALDKPLYKFGDAAKGAGTALAVTRDAKLAALAILGQETGVLVYDLAGGGFALQELKGHTGAIGGMAFSPDGALLATASMDNSLRLWDMATGKQIKRQVVGDHGVLSVAWSPDGEKLVSGGGDGQVRVWDKAGQPVTAVAFGKMDLPDLDFNPAGTLLAAAAEYDNAVALIDAKTWKTVKVLRGHDLVAGQGIYSVAFSPDGKLLASGGADTTVHVWDVDPASKTYGQSLVTLQGHSDWPNSLLWTPDGSALVSGSERDGTVRVWQVVE